MNKPISEISIKNFRGISDLSIKNLSDVNLFVGENNGGKTSILEAVSCLRSGDAYNLFRICRDRKREGASINDVRFLFFRGKSSFSVKALFDDGTQCNFRSSYSIHSTTFDKGVFFKDKEKSSMTHLFMDLVDTMGVNGKEVQMLDLEIERDGETQKESILGLDLPFGMVKKKNKKDPMNIVYVHPASHYKALANELAPILKSDAYTKLLIELLRLFDPRIESIDAIPDDLLGDNQVFIKRKDEDPKPISVYGDGTKKILSLAISVVRAKGGYLLLDEIETSLHYGLIKNALLFLIRISQRFHVQLFITTHSKETIDCFYDVMSEQEERLRVYTLRKEGDKSFVRVLTGTEAKQYERAGVEVRL